MMVKINKVVPIAQNPGAKTLPFTYEQKQYVIAPTTLQQNYTGYPIYVYFVMVLPQANHDYQYLKIQIKVCNVQYRNTIINLKQEVFKTIKRGALKRETVFEFVPSIRGVYQLTIDYSFRAQYFVQGSQPPPQKRDTKSIKIKCQQPFQIKQYILNQDKSSSITFPLFLQYSIQSKLLGQQLKCELQFNSQKFKYKQLHNERKIKLKRQEIYYLLYEIEPKSIKEVVNQKGITIGVLGLKYGVKGSYEKKTVLKTTNKYVFFKAVAETKEVAKKDIVEVKAVFSKIYNANFNLGNLRLVIDQKQMPQVKILKTSVDSINLDQNKSAAVTFTIICLKSGLAHLKGISLLGNEDITVYFINELILNVGTQPQRKIEPIMENTSQFFVVADSQL